MAAAVRTSATRRLEPDMQSFDDMRSHLGQRVLVTLDYDDPKATVVGVLHRLTDDGEVHVREDGGAMAYCWPCLRVEPWPNDHQSKVHYELFSGAWWAACSCGWRVSSCTNRDRIVGLVRAHNPAWPGK